MSTNKGNVLIIHLKYHITLSSIFCKLAVINMQTELCLRLLGPIPIRRESNYDPIKEGLELLNINLETDCVDCYLSEIKFDPYTFDDLWFLESSCKILQFIDVPSLGFRDWYHGLDFNMRRELLQFSLQAFLFRPILQQLLDLCSFFGANLQFSNHRQKIYVILYKYIQHKFNYRPKLSNPSHVISQICRLIQKSRVRLNAELARLRVEEGATTLYHLLSEESRHQLETQSNNTLLYLRTTKLFDETLESCSECTICDLMCKLGLTQAANEEELLIVPTNSRQFKFLLNHKDLIAVSANSYSYFAQHPLTKQGYLQLVDITSYNLITYSTRDIDLSGDVILTHYGTGYECVQLSEYLNGEATLHVFDTDNLADATATLSQYRINNVVLYREGLGEYNEMNTAFSNVNTILCLPSNSQESVRSKFLPALTDVACLPALFRTSQLDMTDVVAEQKCIVSTSLQMRSVDVVYYFVHSTDSIESSEVINSQLKLHTEQASYLKQRIFSINPVTHGIFLPNQQGFLAVPASVKHSGYFAASLRRNSPSPPPKPLEVIEKAVNDGLIQLCDTDTKHLHLKKCTKVKKHHKQRPLFSSSTSKEVIPMTFTTRQKVSTKHFFAATLNTKPLHGKPFR